MLNVVGNNAEIFEGIWPRTRKRKCFASLGRNMKANREDEKTVWETMLSSQESSIHREEVATRVPLSRYEIGSTG
jgi:hypothetical protein